MIAGITTLNKKRSRDAFNAAAALTPISPKKKTAVPSLIPRSPNENGSSVFARNTEAAASEAENRGTVSKLSTRKRYCAKNTE